MNIEWMNGICYDYREPRRPFGVRTDRDLAVATNGHVLVAVPTDSPLPPYDTVSPHVAAILAREGDHQVIEWDRLCRFLADTREVCPVCNGVAPLKVHCDDCCGEGFTECDSCGHESDCDDCNGRGYLGGCRACDDAKLLLGTVGKASINRRLLNMALGPLTAEVVHVYSSGELDPVKFITPEWAVIVMPFRDGGGIEL